MSFLVAPPQDCSRWECWAAVGARGKTVEKACLRRDCFWVWLLVTLLPLGGVFLSECFLLFTRLEPSWCDADSSRAAAFCVLAPGVLGMDRRGSGVRISFRRGLLNAVASKVAKLKLLFPSAHRMKSSMLRESADTM